MNLSLYRKLNVRYLFVSKAITSRFCSSTASAGEIQSSLYRKISPLGDPSISMVPVLDKWFKEGNHVDPDQLRRIVRELRTHSRFKHALEVSQWMTDKLYIPPSCGDVAARLNLIFKVHGIEQAENYLGNISKHVKGIEAYTAMLNCYAHEKSVEKAEMLMQKMKDMDIAKRTICYNIMMNLYYSMGNLDKIDALLLEMEEKGITRDQFTLGIQLSAYAAASDIDGMDKIINMMEYNPQMVFDFNLLAVAAHGYIKVGLVDKSMTLLKKLEELISTKRNSKAIELVLGLYAKAGKKDDVYRIWKHYRQTRKVFTKGYLTMISSLLMLDDIKGAEEIFRKWKSEKLRYDIRLPCILIDAYCKRGLLNEAEFLINQAEKESGKTSVDAWYCLARGYLEDNQIPKAAEAMKKAISVCPSGWKPGKETLATCVEYLEGMGDVEGADRFLKLLMDEGIVSESAHNRLMNYIKGREMKILYSVINRNWLT